MPAPSIALALLLAPLPEPAIRSLPPAMETAIAQVFAGGIAPRQPGLTDLGGPMYTQQMQTQERLVDRFGDLAAPAQVDRQLGRR